MNQASHLRSSIYPQRSQRLRFRTGSSSCSETFAPKIGIFGLGFLGEDSECLKGFRQHSEFDDASD